MEGPNLAPPSYEESQTSQYNPGGFHSGQYGYGTAPQPPPYGTTPQPPQYGMGLTPQVVRETPSFGRVPVMTTCMNCHANVGLVVLGVSKKGRIRKLGSKSKNFVRKKFLEWLK